MCLACSLPEMFKWSFEIADPYCHFVIDGLHVQRFTISETFGEHRDRKHKIVCFPPAKRLTGPTMVLVDDPLEIEFIGEDVAEGHANCLPSQHISVWDNPPVIELLKCRNVSPCPRQPEDADTPRQKVRNLATFVLQNCTITEVHFADDRWWRFFMAYELIVCEIFCRQDLYATFTALHAAAEQ